MQHLTKKVIMASAGTGKTFRLSLEYISLLLKYKDYSEFNFSQIVVMTFTKKATAEIRDKILEFLEIITTDTEEAQEIIDACQSSCKYKITDEDIEYIRNVLLAEILSRKDLLQVSTIDSFTSNIFKSMIAPYLRINDYTIDNNSNEEIKDSLLTFIFSDKAFPTFKPLLNRLNIRTVDHSVKFLNSMIENRWILDYYEKGELTGEIYRIINVGLDRFNSHLGEKWAFFREMYLGQISIYEEQYLKVDQKPIDKALLKDYKTLLNIDDASKRSLVDYFDSFLSNPEYVMKNIKLLFSKPFPFTTRCKKAFKVLFDELKVAFEECLHSLADYYLMSQILTKQVDVIKAWTLLCQEYDRLKFALGKFTYSDITFYTYKYLYEETLSLIDFQNKIVTNVFYEQLVSRIRFLLIDEFQDTSINQFAILMPIINELTSGYAVKDYSGVIVVGDPKQSIYGWRGGERGIMNVMPSILQTQAESLDTCYRAIPTVMSLVNRTFEDQVFQKETKEIDCDWTYDKVASIEKEKSGDVFYWEYNSKNEEHTENDEYRLFAQEIDKLIKSDKIVCGQTAILVRTNKHATEISNELNKLKINNSIESSEKLLNHKAVRLLHLLLKFKLLNDKYSLLAFLRSDLVLLDSDELVKILKSLHNYVVAKEVITDYKKISDNPELLKVLSLVNQDYERVSDFVEAVLNSYDFAIVCENETDWKNIYTFRELVYKFEMSKLNASAFDLFGFVEYCQKQQEEQSEILQKGLKLHDSITILTVHKSKGLGFDNVFVFWKLSNRVNSSKGDKFEFIYSFNEETYLNIVDFIIYSTALEKKVIEMSEFSNVLDFYRRREVIEAIDVFYVALTRAKLRLGLFINYSSKADLEEYIETLNESPKMIGRLIEGYKSFFRESEGEIHSMDKLVSFSYSNSFENRREENSSSGLDSKEFNLYLKDFMDKGEQVTFEENRPIENMKKVYLQDKHQLYGNVAHYYLSYIKYGTEIELDKARAMTSQLFGSLLDSSSLVEIQEICNKFIANNPEIFSNKWDAVFNEKVVYDNGQEQRIDRMMVDHSAKEIMIVDYKTGHIGDKDQIERYKEIIANISLVSQQGYKVKGVFVKVV